MPGGNIAAFFQNDLKRMLAYSGVADAGYLLIGIVANSQGGDPGHRALPLRADAAGAGIHPVLDLKFYIRSYSDTHQGNQSPGSAPVVGRRVYWAALTASG